MIDLPQLTESHIRAWTDPGSFGRGQGYYRAGHTITPRRQGSTLKARCIGSRPEPYCVEITLGPGGIARGECSCPVGAGGHCKHAVALLLTWLQRPDTFTTVEDVETALERRSKAELVVIIRRMLERHPGLEQVLELPIFTAAEDAPPRSSLEANGMVSARQSQFHSPTPSEIEETEFVRCRRWAEQRERRSCVLEMEMRAMDYKALQSAVIEGDVEGATRESQRAIAADADPKDILNSGLIPGMEEVGRLYEEGSYFLPEMLAAAQAMKAGLTELRPLLAEQDVEPVGRVALGTVQGDIHDIGKNLVGIMLEGAGFEIVDLGADVPPEAFLDAASDVQAIGLSALLTTTMPAMEQVIEMLEEAGVRDEVKVVVGGAPVTGAFAEKIGADGYSPDASSAVRKVKGLLGI